MPENKDLTLQSRRTPSQPIRVLVVDDVGEICTLIHEIMRRFPVVPWEVVSEPDPHRALSLVERDEFDIVISDFRLRDVDGLQILGLARARNPAGHRVLMSGYNEIPAEPARVAAAYLDAYLQKPFHPDELLDILRTLVEGSPRALEALRVATAVLLAGVVRTRVALVPGVHLTEEPLGGEVA